MVKKKSTKKKSRRDVSKSPTEVEKLLIENFIILQKVLSDMTVKFGGLSEQISKLLALLNESGKEMSECKITPENFAELLCMLYTKQIGSKVAQDVLKIMFEKGSDPSDVVRDQGLTQVSDEGELDSVIQEVILANEGPVNDFKAGQENAIQFLIGQVMAKTKGKADPGVAAKLLREKLLKS